MGWRKEGRDLHLNTSVLATPGCGEGRAATLPKLAALLSPLSTLSPAQRPPLRNGVQGVGCGCPSHACEWYLSGYTSMCGVSDGGQGAVSTLDLGCGVCGA